MAERFGFTERPAHEEPTLNLTNAISNRCDYVPDERTGTDRWGRDRSTLTACGTGWGPDDYICPAYLEESCPGDKNKFAAGALAAVYANTHAICDLDCGSCGGGGRAETIAYCGWPKGRPMWDAVIGEMGGSLRLDRYKITAPPPPGVEKWPVNFIPSLEWAAKNWISVLGEETGYGTYPAICTSIRTASPGERRDGMPLRERLGGYEGFLIIHGLVKDDVLDDWWDDRKRLFAWNLKQGVNVMIAPQYSYYDDEQMCMGILNVNRSMRWYVECVDAGFEHVGMDFPPTAPNWLWDELLAFRERVDCRILSISYQTMNERGGMDPGHMRTLRLLNELLPRDVSFLIFGIGNVLGMSQAKAMLAGRNVSFLSSEPFARTAFWHLMTNEHAPKKWSKGKVFAWNTKYVANLADKVDKADEKRRQRRENHAARVAAAQAAKTAA